MTLIEKNTGPAQGASFANAGSMTASRAGPWASPKSVVRTLKGYFNKDSAFKLSLRADLGQLRWLVGFLQSAYGRYGAPKREAMISLALEGIRERKRIDSEFHLEYGGVYPRLLTIYDSEGDLSAAAQDLKYLATLGVSADVVSRADCRTLEPNVDWSSVKMAGATLATDDETADCFCFCQEMDRINHALGVSVRYDSEVVRVDAKSFGKCTVVTRGETLQSDAVVVAAGTQSVRLAQSHGLRLPMYPVKGYSLSVQLPEPMRPRLTIAHEKRKVFVAPMTNGLRAAGVADIVGYRDDIDWRRVDLVRRTIRDLFPSALLDGSAPAWSGLRAMTHDGPPIICGMPGSGLWFNTGHGSLGWTFSLASAKSIAEQVLSRRYEPANPFFGLRYR